MRGDRLVFSHSAALLSAALALDLDPQRVQVVELVERRLGSRPVRVFRSLYRLEQKGDLLFCELESPVDDLLHLRGTVDRLPDHVVGVADDLRTSRPEQLFRACEGYALESGHNL